MQRKAGLWIRRKRYTARRAERALKALLCTPTYKEHVREILGQIVREDGVATLCAAAKQLPRASIAPQRTDEV